MAAELYRLRVGMRKGGTSWGETKYFEDRDAFEGAVFEALLDVQIKDSRGWRLRVLSRIQEIRGKKKTEARIDKVFAVEQLLVGEWIELKATLIEPRLELN